MNPTIGMGATIYHYSDRDPATVIEVSPSGKRIVIQEDKSIRLDNNGMSECQVYRYEPDPGGTMHIATLRKDGTYRLVGRKTIVSLGERHRYYDYSF